MHDVRLDHGPIGPVRLDEYGTPVLDIHIRKVARVDGKLTNTIIKTYPQVSQFWTYDPKKFVAAAGVLARLSAEQISRIGAASNGVRTAEHLAAAAELAVVVAAEGIVPGVIEVRRRLLPARDVLFLRRLDLGLGHLFSRF